MSGPNAIHDPDVGVQIVDALGNPVSVTGGKLDVNATVTATIDPTGLATSTIQTDGSQKSQIVDAGGEAVTVTGGKLDVNASIDTTGLATSAKQDTLDTSVNTLLKPASTLTKVATVDTITNVVHVDDNSGSLTVDNAGLTALNGAINSNKVDVNIVSGGTGGGAMTVADGADVTLGAKADAKNAATDTTPATVVGILKEISYMEQNPASRAVTNAGTFPVQATLDAETTKVIGTVNISAAQSVTANAGTNLNTSSLALEAGGNLAAIKAKTDNIPALGQALAADSVPVVLTAAQLTTLTPPAAITGFATEAGHLATIDSVIGAKTDAKSTATDGTSVSIMQVLKEISAMEQAPASRAVTNTGTFAVQSTNQANSGVDIGDVTINNAAGASAVNIQDGGNVITVDGTVSANATLAAETTKVIGTVNLNKVMGEDLLIGNGVTGNGSPRVTIASNNTPFAVKTDQTTHGTTDLVASDNTKIKGVALSVGNGTADTGCQRVTIASDNTAFPVNSACAGNVASDAADSGNPIKTGGIAKSADITAVANNDRVDSVYDLLGKQVVQPYALPQNLVSGQSGAMTGTTSTQLIAAVASNYLYITSLLVTNSHATVGTLVSLQDGNGGTAFWSGYAAPVGGGYSITFPVPLKCPTSGNAVYVVNGTTGSNTYVSACGYKSTI